MMDRLVILLFACLKKPSAWRVNAEATGGTHLWEKPEKLQLTSIQGGFCVSPLSH